MPSYVIVEVSAAELEANAKNLKPSDWPFAVVEMFLGSRTPEATLAAAGNPAQVCEAHFYTGEWQLVHANKVAAADEFKAATEACAKGSIEQIAVELELKRLGQ